MNPAITHSPTSHLAYQLAGHGLAFGASIVSSLAISNPDSSFFGRAFSLFSGIAADFLIPESVQSTYEVSTLVFSTAMSYLGPPKTLTPYHNVSTEIMHGIGYGASSAAVGYSSTKTVSTILRPHPQFRNHPLAKNALTGIYGFSHFFINEKVRVISSKEVLSTQNVITHLASTAFLYKAIIAVRNLRTRA